MFSWNLKKGIYVTNKDGNENPLKIIKFERNEKMCVYLV